MKKLMSVEGTIVQYIKKMCIKMCQPKCGSLIESCLSRSQNKKKLKRGPYTLPNQLGNKVILIRKHTLREP